MRKSYVSLCVLTVGVCISAIMASAVRADFVCAARLADTAVSLDPTTLAYGGAQSTGYGGDLKGIDISQGDSFAYMVDDNGYIQQLVKNTLTATGVNTNTSGSWDSGDIFVSVDVGADGYVYGARNNASAVKIDPVTLTYAGAGSSGIKGADISVGHDYAYMVQGYLGNDTIVRLDKNTLAYTGVQSAWGGGDIMLSVDVGPDGFVYAARNGDTAVKLDPITLVYAGRQSGNPGVDISMGTDYAYLAQTNGTDTVLLLDKNTLAYAGAQSNWDGGHIMTSVDVSSVVPEPGTFALLLTATFGLLAYGWRKRK
jgi:hypothetical protein